MLTREAARFRVVRELESDNGRPEGPEELVIIDDQVLERSWGWVFPYTTRGCLDGDDNDAIAGNGPIMVNRHDGTLRPCGTAYPTEYYIRLYEAELAKQAGEAAEASPCAVDSSSGVEGPGTGREG